MWDFLRANHSPVPFGSAKTDPDSVKGIHILEGGKLSSSVYEILDLIKEYNLVLATGHISKHESLAVFKEAEKRGIEKMIATHTEFPATYADIEEQKEYIKCGAKIEHNYLTILNKEFTMEKLKEQIQAVGAEHVILSSDLGPVSYTHLDVYKRQRLHIIESPIKVNSLNIILLKARQRD